MLHLVELGNPFIGDFVLVTLPSWGMHQAECEFVAVSWPSIVCIWSKALLIFSLYNIPSVRMCFTGVKSAKPFWLV